MIWEVLPASIKKICSNLFGPGLSWIPIIKRRLNANDEALITETYRF
jgi:hypothetical protein